LNSQGKLSVCDKGSNIDNFLIISFLALLCILWYFWSLNFNFVGDDWGIIYEKKSLFDKPRFLKEIFFLPTIKHGLREKLYHYYTITSETSYRPLNTLSYFIDYKIWGMRPWGFHLTNILFHCGNVALLYLLASAISGYRLFGFLAGLLFAIHPFGSETVCVVSFREDLMALFFILLSCLTLFKYLNTQKRGLFYLGLSFIFYVCAILCKENSVVAWAVFFYLIMALRNKLNTRRGAVLFLISGGVVGLVFTWMRWMYNPPGAINPLVSNFKIWIYTLGDVFGNYIFYIMIPWHFKFYFPWQYIPPSGLNLRVLVHIAGVLVVVTGGFYVFLRSSARELKFGFVWMGAFFTPLCFIQYLPSLQAARYLYIPGAGAVMVIAWVFHQGLKEKKYRVLTAVMFSSYLIYLGIINRREMVRWENDVVFYEIQKEEFPDSWRVHKKYGDFLLSLNYVNLALKEYTNAYLINLSGAEILEKLASTLFALREYDKAEKFYLKALEANPDSVIACKGLGIIYGLRSRKKEALFYLQRALHIAPDDEEVKENIQKVKAGRKDFKLFRPSER